MLKEIRHFWIAAIVIVLSIYRYNMQLDTGYTGYQDVGYQVLATMITLDSKVRGYFGLHTVTWRTLSDNYMTTKIAALNYIQ